MNPSSEKRLKRLRNNKNFKKDYDRFEHHKKVNIKTKKDKLRKKSFDDE